MIKKLVQIQILKRLCVKIRAILQAELRQKKKKFENVFHEFFNNVRFWHTPFFNALWEKLKSLCIICKNVESHEKSSYVANLLLQLRLILHII